MIKACVCFGKPFSYLSKVAHENNLTTTQQVEEKTQCGSKCKLCRPYIEKMLATGQIEFPGRLY